jgi:WD40-like Beta Propeller Repeat
MIAREKCAHLSRRGPYRHTSVLVPILILALSACSDSSTGPDPDGPATVTAVAQRFPIDGDVTLGDVGVVRESTFDMRDQMGQGQVVGTVTLRWAVANDDRNLYLAATWSDGTRDDEFDLTVGPVDFDGLRVEFDLDGNGSFEMGEDIRTVIAASVGSTYVDQHRVPVGQNETDTVANGLAKLNWNATTGTYSAEFLVPLADDGPGEDGLITASSRMNMTVMNHARIAEGTGSVGAVHGIGVDSSTWNAVDWADVVAASHPVLPTNPGGLVVFIGGQDETNGELYRFDPATRVTTRITQLPGLFKDASSLSHDRSRVAFHASPSKSDANAYEIYVVNIDGTNLQQLTNNSIIDGHPAWSPDDSRLAYASFREPGMASIVVMDTSGSEIADLTPAGVDDNDPEFLPDGRITFKTDRFSTLPEVRTAVMNVDGTNVVQLSFGNGFSDHDPVGDGTEVVFERFPKTTAFYEDVESGFIGWKIVQASLDGTGEQVLVDDGWIDWLPVYSPDGSYIAFLRGFGGGTELGLMTRDGQVLGRWVGDQSQITYFDWK